MRTYKERLALYFDRDKARAVLKAKGYSVYKVAIASGGSNRRFQKMFMPSSPPYKCVTTDTVNELARIVGCSPLDFLTLLGPKERGGQADFPPELRVLSDEEVMADFQRPAKATKGGQNGHTPAPAEIPIAGKGDFEEIEDPFG